MVVLWNGDGGIGFSVVLVNLIARYTIWLPRRYKKVKKKKKNWEKKIKVYLVTIKKKKERNGKHKKIIIIINKQIKR